VIFPSLPGLDVVFLLGISMSAILAARELRLIRFRLPQVDRQTVREWAYDYGFVTAAGMWGAHIGIGFATVIQHGGFYVLVLLAMQGGWELAASLFCVYWIGRTLPIWATVAFRSYDRKISRRERQLDGVSESTCFNHLAVAGLAVAAAGMITDIVSKT